MSLGTKEWNNKNAQTANKLGSVVGRSYGISCFEAINTFNIYLYVKVNYNYHKTVSSCDAFEYAVIKWLNEFNVYKTYEKPHKTFLKKGIQIAT